MSASRPIPPPSAPRAEHEPPVVQVTVVQVDADEVEVRLVDGRPGVIPADDFRRAGLADSGPGEVISAAVLAREDPHDRVTLSAAWAASAAAWARATAALGSGSTLQGRVIKAIKGGYVVDVGVRAFLPRSLVGDEPPGAAPLVGRELEVSVSELDRGADRLVVSRRDVLRRERRELEKQAWSELEVGQRREGRVVAVEDYGAKVDLGELRGLVHRSEISWGPTPHPSKVLAVGDLVHVVVLEVNRSRRRIGLSVRQAAEHPFAGIEVGSLHAGTVTRVLDYGAFVRLDGTDAEGLMHVSEISELPGSRADQLVVPGESLRVKVLSVDESRNRMSLSVLQAALEP